MHTDEFDFVVIGSGFGGSVSALRLSEKGHRVAVLEMGKRWLSEDFPETNWSLRKYLWRPEIGCHGIMAMTLLSDAFIMHGAGVGGGSLVYANTLLVPPDSVYEDRAWRHLGDWKSRLAAPYATARKMLGAVPAPMLPKADRIMRDIANDMGRGHTFHMANVGVYFGDGPNVAAKDPFFGGRGPDRVGCNFCGGCMVGCRFNAKNTLDKNYLYLAEGLGAKVIPERRVIDVRPLSGGGYEIVSERSTSFLRKDVRTIRARGVVFSGGVLGTVRLLMQCKDSGSLPDLSPRLGEYVRTNSEAILGVSSNDTSEDFTRGIAIMSGFFPDDKTHVEIVRFSKGSDALAPLATLLTPGGPPWPRQLRWLAEVAKHPVAFARTLVPFGWSQRSAIVLVMQPVDNHMKLTWKRRRFWPFGKTLDSDAEGSEIPTYIPIANDFTQRMAERMGGIGRSGTIEVLFDVATTAHILGGCPMGRSADDGVIDDKCRVHNYEDMYVIDGSMLQANLGVNPSFTITAMAEWAMSHVPASARAGVARAPASP